MLIFRLERRLCKLIRLREGQLRLSVALGECRFIIAIALLELFIRSSRELLVGILKLTIATLQVTCSCFLIFLESTHRFCIIRLKCPQLVGVVLF